MGIPFLTKHLLPHADCVSFGRENTATTLPCTQAVVIDGPSLVYHVHHRLLAWLDAPPTCREISQGVVRCLQQLQDHDVKIHQICFDGALPISKRDVRLARLEKTRQRLESCRQRHTPPYANIKKKTAVQSSQLWQGKSFSSRWKDVPESPFMVSTVFNDLCHWWNGERVRAEIDADFSCANADFPWAESTVMVPGEADTACAEISKATGAAVLTNDSDMIIHDLGLHGAVVFLNTIYLVEGHPNQTIPELRGSRIRPSDICQRLGISDIRRFAYELTKSPRLQFTDLLRRSKQATDSGEESADYSRFLEEYCPTTDHSEMAQRGPHSANLDPRIAELYWQYEQPGLFCTLDGPHVYLGVVFEDHSRRCAWEQGRAFRELGYSLINLCQPDARRYAVIHEFVRRGKRVISEQVVPSDMEHAAKDVDLFLERLDLARTFFEAVPASQFWVLFALSEIFSDPSNTTALLSATQLQTFLETGQLGDQLAWADVHLIAQVQAVLYSLRILKQLLEIHVDQSGPFNFLPVLFDLPPLNSLVGSLHDLMRMFPTEEDARFSIKELLRAYSD